MNKKNKTIEKKCEHKFKTTSLLMKMSSKLKKSILSRKKWESKRMMEAIKEQFYEK